MRRRRIARTAAITAPATPAPINTHAHPGSPLESGGWFFVAAAAPAAAAAPRWPDVAVDVVVEGGGPVVEWITVVVCADAVVVFVLAGAVMVFVLGGAVSVFVLVWVWVLLEDGTSAIVAVLVLEVVCSCDDPLFSRPV